MWSNPQAFLLFFFGGCSFAFSIACFATGIHQLVK